MKMSRRACFFLAYTLATTAPLVCSEALENGTSRSERRECVNRTKNGGENIVAGVALYLSGATSFYTQHRRARRYVSKLSATIDAPF